jgi:hypothetical protein
MNRNRNRHSAQWPVEIFTYSVYEKARSDVPGLKSMCENCDLPRLCSARLQASTDTLESARCPPEGGRYTNQNRTFTQNLMASGNDWTYVAVKATTHRPSRFSTLDADRQACGSRLSTIFCSRSGMPFYSSSTPVAFLVGTNPTGIRATSFIALRSIAETSFVTAFAT